ncbi:MAG: hypothetical protein R2851_13605 [Caldilineaceae bacterium]
MVVEDPDGTPWGYFAYNTWSRHHQIDEIAADAGRSLRELACCHTPCRTEQALPPDDPEARRLDLLPAGRPSPGLHCASTDNWNA